jgi:hypothetical protein
VAEFDEVIPPGQVGYINVEILGEKVSGSWTKNATVHSNDPDHPQMTISLSGTILHHVDIKPSTRMYLRGMYGEKVVKEITVSSSEQKKDFVIENVSSNVDDKITYKVNPTGEPGVYKIRVWKNPKLPAMNTWGSLTLETNSEHTPEKVVQVNVNTRGAIIVQPSTINFGGITEDAVGETAETMAKAVTIFKVKGDFTIRDVRFSSSYYSADIEEIEGGKKFKVTVNFKPPVHKSSYIDEMVINTDDPQEPSIRVRLLARGI